MVQNLDPVNPTDPGGLGVPAPRRDGKNRYMTAPNRNTAMLLLSTLWGCGSTPEPVPRDLTPWTHGVSLPAETTEGGDPIVGRHALLHGDYMTCGVPFKLWALGGGPIANTLGGDKDAPKIPDREGANADLPYNLNAFTTPDGVEVVNANCLMCHGGMADGELVIGLGNATADFTGDGSAAQTVSSETLDALGLDAAEKAQFEMMSNRAAAIADYSVMRTIGNNPAEGLAIALMLHHDRDTLAWSDEPLVEALIKDHDGKLIADAVVTSDPPPWWRAKKKNALFYNGMARGDHRGTMALATSLCVDTVARAEEVDAGFKDIHAYVRSITAPVWPRSINADLAAEGQILFERDCGGCHGSYANDPTNDDADSYPNLLLPLEVIGTDPVVAEGGVVHAPELVEWYNGSFYGKRTRMEPSDPFPGYMAPPLDGIWATAPYLHNGSVPTIELVLNSAARPAVWRRVDDDSTNIDEDALGWPWLKVDQPQASLPDYEKPYVYDTSHWSQSKAGHIFGDHLSAAERRAVVEYLKTL